MLILTGDDFKRMRKHANLTQKEAAEILGVSVGTIQNYEAGITYPKEWVLEQYTRIDVLASEHKKEEQKPCNLKSYRVRLKAIELRLREDLTMTQALIKEIEDEIGEGQ